MARALRRSFAVLLSAGVAAFFACREPTQITLVLTTDAGCPSSGALPELNDIAIVTGKQLVLGTPDNPQPFPAVATQTDMCAISSGDVNTVGTLVLLPDGSENPTVEVLIAAGVRRDATGNENSMSAQQCLERAFNGQSIEGLACILARRRLAFVEHNSLTLPVLLDQRCIGEDCGSELTCYQGNCVSPDVLCAEDASTCDEPLGCPNECENTCMTGVGVCEGGACTCLPCDDQECAASDQCGAGFEGVCSEDDTQCGCAEVCDPNVCGAQGGTCEGTTCVLPSCTAEMCSGPCANGSGVNECVDLDGQLTCICTACDPVTCESGRDCQDHELGECGTVNGDPACICACDAEECAQAVGSGCGFCNANGQCVETPACSTAACTCAGPGQVSTCTDPCGTCSCVCDAQACSSDCGPLGGQCVNAAGMSSCECNTSTGPGGGGMGGMTSSSTGGFGGGGASGVGGMTSSSTGGFGGGVVTLCPPVLVSTCANCNAACNQANPMCFMETCVMPASGGFVDCLCAMP